MTAQRFFSSTTFRFSIRQLLLGTALVAVGCVALRSASPIWVAALLGLLLLGLTAAVPLAIFRQGSQRAWWFGFGLFGWLYLVLLAYSWSLDANTAQSHPLHPYSLVTARISSSGFYGIYANATVNATENLYYPQVQTGPVPIAYPITVPTPQNPADPYTTPNPPPSIYQSAGSPVSYTVYVGTSPATPAYSGPYHDDFVNVAHAFWALLIALCGGWFTGWLYITRPATREVDPACRAGSGSTS